MPVKSFRPLTPSLRYLTVSSFEEITKDKPEKSDLKKAAIKFNLPLLYIIILVSTLGLSILMTAPTIKLGKPALISTDLESTDGN